MTSETHIPYEQLPLWMRQAKQEFDWGILIVIAMSLAIGWSFFFTSELSAGHQLEHVVFQANDISTGFREGVFYPRWSPYALKGYGAPIPNYYPMGASYTIAVVSALFTNDIYQATRLVFVLAYVVAGLGVYLYLSRRIDSAVGLLGSVLYLYSPMIGSTIPYVMGDIALLIASGILPLTLWTSYRLSTSYQATDLLLHTLLLGFLIWVHPQMAIVSIILSSSLTLLEPSPISRFRRTARLMLSTLVGILLVSFFWIPAMFERDLTQWYSVTTPQSYTLTPIELISPMLPIDAGLLMPQPQFKLGWMLLIFSIIGTFVIVRSKHMQYLNYVLLITTGLLITFSLFLIPSEIWLLSPITLLTAFIGGQTLSIRRYLTPARRRLLLTSSIAATVIFSQPIWSVPAPNLVIRGIDASSQIRFEEQAYGVSTLPDHVALPSVISPDTPVNRSLVNSYALDTPQRYDDRQNNSNTILSLLSTASHQQVYQIFNQFPTELEFILPYFDGWQAYLDGEPIPTYANPTTDLLTISVPTVADGDLIIKLTATPIRHMAWMLSTLTFFILIFLIFIRSRDPYDSYTDRLLETLPRTDIRLLLVMFASLGFIIVVVASETSPLQLQRTPAYSLAQSLPLRSRTSAGIEASTFTLNSNQAHIGDNIEVVIYWQALTDIPNNYHSRVRLKSSTNGVIWVTEEVQPIGNVPTRRWSRNLFVSDTHNMIVPADIFAGEYEVALQVYPCNLTCDLTSPITFFNLDGEPIGSELTLPLSITIR